MEKHQLVLFLVRHGETILNTQKIVQGHIDSKLTEKGKKQAQDLSDLFEGIQIDEIYASDLKRAVHTAKIINKKRSKKISIDKNLRERNYGRFEGKNISELKILDELFNSVDNNKKLTYKAFPDVESDNEVALRVVNFIRDLYSKSFDNKTVIAVTHASAIRSFLLYSNWGTYASLPPHAVKNTSYVKLIVESEDIKIVESWNISAEEIVY